MPPLNLSQTGNICPNTGAAKIRRFIICESVFKKWHGRNVFKKSKRKVNAPNVFPCVLTTFVAPIFFDPISLKLPFPNRLDKIRPKGIDPDR